MFAVWPLKRSFDPGGDDEYLLDAGLHRGRHNAMRSLAKRARSMAGSVRVGVRDLYSCAKEKKKCEECYGKKTDRMVEPSLLPDPAHS